MSRRPSHESVDISHFDDEAAPPRIRKRAAFYGDLARFGTARQSGEAAAIPVQCRKRPNRKRCTGLLVVWRQDAPPAVHWECPVCRYGGSITGWKDSHWDCSDLEEPTDGAEPVLVSTEAHASLREVVGNHPVWREFVYTSLAGDPETVLFVPASRMGELAAELGVAAIKSGNPRRIDKLLEVMQALVPTSVPPANAARPRGHPSKPVFEGAPGGYEVELEPAPGPRRRKRRQTRSDRRSYRIKVSLDHIRPPIWRRIVVPAAISLPELHDVLQVAMGWLDCHLHMFQVGNRVFSPHDPDFEPIGEDSSNVCLGEIAPRARSRVTYEYDFGDGWSHEILVEEILEESCKTVQCLAGKRACPPEDCGGPGGYERLKWVLGDPDHEEHADMMEWVGGSFAPEEFDLDETASALAALKLDSCSAREHAG